MFYLGPIILLVEPLDINPSKAPFSLLVPHVLRTFSTLPKVPLAPGESLSPPLRRYTSTLAALNPAYHHHPRRPQLASAPPLLLAARLSPNLRRHIDSIPPYLGTSITSIITSIDTGCVFPINEDIIFGPFLKFQGVELRFSRIFFFFAFLLSAKSSFFNFVSEI